MSAVSKARLAGKHLRAPSPAMLVALVALFVAMGGTTYAAWNLPAKSVGTEQLRNGAVSTAKLHNGAVSNSKLQTEAVTAGKIQTGAVSPATIANGAVTMAKIRDNAITGAQVKDGSLLAADFAPGSLPSPPLVRSSPALGPGPGVSQVAVCQPGEYAVGGGLSISGGGSSGAVITGDTPEGPGNTGPPPRGSPPPDGAAQPRVRRDRSPSWCGSCARRARGAATPLTGG